MDYWVTGVAPKSTTLQFQVNPIPSLLNYNLFWHIHTCIYPQHQDWSCNSFENETLTKAYRLLYWLIEWVLNHRATSWTSKPENIRNVQRRRYFPVVDKRAWYYTFTVCCEKVKFHADWSEQSTHMNRWKNEQKLDLDFSSIISVYLTWPREQQKAVTNQPPLSGKASPTTLCIKMSWPARVPGIPILGVFQKLS